MHVTQCFQIVSGPELPMKPHNSRKQKYQQKQHQILLQEMLFMRIQAGKIRREMRFTQHMHYPKENIKDKNKLHRNLNAVFRFVR